VCIGPRGAPRDIAKQYGLPIYIVKIYMDADWGRNPHESPSISGGVATVYAGPILYASKEQNLVT
jgi:hypothetical protein